MMAEECTHDCSSCGSACASRQKPQSLLAPANAGSRVKKVIGVVSGKGGVGKSLVTGLLACETARRGKIAGVLDADITGPSMPRILGIRDKAVGNELGILPQEAENGVKVMSINLLLEHDTDPVIWRGSLIAGTVKQFWTDVCWGDVDCLYVDMPPGTGDVPLTVFQSIPLDGVVVVGVGLPQVNLYQEVLRAHFERTLGDGFLYAYMLPGMQKVTQAVGRVIRTETDTGVALLLDDRYSYPAYRRLMPEHWRVTR